MARIQGIEEGACLWSANFTDNDPVRPVAKRSFEQVGETDLALVSIELGLGRDNVRFS
jgi:hypothetical protein